MYQEHQMVLRRHCLPWVPPTFLWTPLQPHSEKVTVCEKRCVSLLSGRPHRTYRQMTPRLAFLAPWVLPPTLLGAQPALAKPQRLEGSAMLWSNEKLLL